MQDVIPCAPCRGAESVPVTCNGTPDPVRLEAYAAGPRGNRSTRSWTVDELLMLLDPDLTVNAVMARLTIEKRATETFELVRLRRAGFPVPVRANASVRAPRTLALEDDLRAGMTEAEATRRHGVSRSRVREVRSRAGIPVGRTFWTDEERALVITHQDRPVREVAEMLGRPVPAVYNERKRLIGKGRLQPKIARPKGRGDS